MTDFAALNNQRAVSFTIALTPTTTFPLRAIMFCKSISRVARSTTSLPVSSASAARTSAGSAQAASCKASALYQRRHSSSKPSCPPGGSGKSESDAATENPTRRSTNSTRLPRRKAKEAAEEIALKARDAAFARLPAVPPTSHMSELGELTFVSITTVRS